MRRDIGIVVFAVAMFIVAANVTNRFGRPVGIGFAALWAGAAYAGHSVRARQFVGLLRDAVARHLSMKDAAITADVTPSQLSAWWSGKEQLSFPRASEWGDPVWTDFCRTYLEGHGFVVIESGRVAELVMAVRAQHAAADARAAATLPRFEVAS